MGASTRIGTIDLIELTTPDIAPAADFYAKLLGWEYEILDRRWLAEVNGRRVAVIAPESRTIGDMPLPASWTIAIRVARVADEVARMEALGATVIHPPDEVSDGWRAALVQDPTGAFFSMVEASADVGIDARSATGSLGCCELLTNQRSAAVRFYEEAFGWSAEVDAVGSYTSFFLDGEPVAGLLASQRLPHASASVWLPFFRVADPGATATTAIALGGTVAVPAHRADSQVFAVIEDPAGAMFAVVEEIHVQSLRVSSQ
jgi:uncharacterized protein